MKLLASDIDGTFIDDSLDSNGEYNIPLSNIKAVDKWIASGNVFLVASGRTYPGEKQFTDKLGEQRNIYFSTCNGASLYDLSGRCLMNKTLTYKAFLMLVKAFPYQEDNTYMVYFTDGTMGYLGKENFAPIESKSNKTPLKNLNGVEIDLSTPIEKAQIACGKHDSYAHKAPQELLDLCDAFSTSDFFFEIVGKGVDKAASVASLAELLKVKHDDIYVCGDSYNDLKMLSSFHGATPLTSIVEAQKKAEFVGCKPGDGLIAEALTKAWKLI
jgi:Cof subfamily protein (haloacid dehalogenase superfamily)